MKTARTHRLRAFTIMELLVVVAIIAVVAGLVVGLAGSTGKTKKISRTQAELNKLITLIDAYKIKVGVYPPDNRDNPDRNSLLYELGGAIRDRSDDANPQYDTPFGSIKSNELWSTYGGIVGILNAVEKEGTAEDSKVHRILTDLKRDQTNLVAGHLSLVVPVEGLDGQPGRWQYLRSPNATNNPNTYDLWVEIVVDKKKGVPETRIIGNWKN